MLHCLPGMDINNFVDVQLPTKGQIFSRTGQHAVSPSGSYTKDDPAVFGRTTTESAADFLAQVDASDFPAD